MDGRAGAGGLIVRLIVAEELPPLLKAVTTKLLDGIVTVLVPDTTPVTELHVMPFGSAGTQV
jgi:hypothetical protein